MLRAPEWAVHRGFYGLLVKIFPTGGISRRSSIPLSKRAFACGRGRLDQRIERVTKAWRRVPRITGDSDAPRVSSGPELLEQASIAPRRGFALNIRTVIVERSAYR